MLLPELASIKTFIELHAFTIELLGLKSEIEF